MRIHILIFSALFMIIFSCKKKDDAGLARNDTQYVPVYMSFAELRNSVKAEGPRPLKNPGKIYTYNQYLLVNEIYEGIHIINNANPENPINQYFIKIPGNIDLAVKDNILYADNSVDLVALDISNPAHIEVVKRIEEILPVPSPPDGEFFVYEHKKGAIVGWK